MYSPRNENLNLLVRIRFYNLFYISKFIKTEKFTGLNKVLLVFGQRSGIHREDCPSPHPNFLTQSKNQHHVYNLFVLVIITLSSSILSFSV